MRAKIYLIASEPSGWLMRGGVARRAGSDYRREPPTGLSPTADGHINIAASGDNLWRRFCEAAEASELINDPDYADGQLRLKNRPALNERLREITRKHTSAHWVKVLNEAGVPCGPIYTIDQTFADPQ